MPANTSPMPDGEYRPVCECVWRQMHSRLGVDAGVSGSRDGRVWEQRRTHTGWCSPKGIGAEAEAMFFRLSARFPADTNKS